MCWSLSARRTVGDCDFRATALARFPVLHEDKAAWGRCRQSLIRKRWPSRAAGRMERSSARWAEWKNRIWWPVARFFAMFVTDTRINLPSSE